jgi:cyanophycinase
LQDVNEAAKLAAQGKKTRGDQYVTRAVVRLGAAALCLFAANCCRDVRAQHAAPVAASAVLKKPENRPGGTCVIIGGGLRRDNAAVFQRLIEAAGGPKLCRIAVLSSASRNTRGAWRFAAALEAYGVAADRIAVVDIRPENAVQAAFDPANIAELRRATAVYFVGGDQERILAALRKADGGNTPALAAINEMFARGGAVAGSSAGAAVQSKTMIAVAGLGDRGLDEGMDALDFGLTSDPSRRGLLVTAGLGFFRGGIVDQHFSQVRGRLGRLARAASERRVRFGFGIDENTAMIVGPGGTIDVLGTGCVTIVDAAAAVCDDGPLGCRIRGLRISCMGTGDRFDPQAAALTVNPAKKPSIASSEWNSNNHLITDIDAVGAVPYALFSGLCNNIRDKQVGVALRYSRSFAHGYRFTFQKLKTTRIWAGHVDNIAGMAVQDVALDIEPIVGTLRSPETALPIDLPAGPASPCEAVWFRGVLLADDARHFRPEAALTRAELATAIAQSVNLDAPSEDVRPADVPESAAWSDEVGEVVTARIMELDAKGRFRPDAAVTRQEAAQVLARAVKFAESLTGWRRSSSGESSKDGTANADSARPMTRREAATALARLMELPW